MLYLDKTIHITQPCHNFSLPKYKQQCNSALADISNCHFVGITTVFLIVLGIIITVKLTVLSITLTLVLNYCLFNKRIKKQELCQKDMCHKP